MAKVTIDGSEYELPDGMNLLQAALGKGLDIPYFCWHPALGSVGACRQCAVRQYRDAEDERGMLVMSCMVPCSEGARFAVNSDPDIVKFRETVTEWLMTNHPHDCPVCDEGGHCHLQDMTVMTGHNYRSYRFTKRTYTNQNLGPHINHEMNRCITCYRCVRYYDDYAGGKDLQAMASHNHVYFGRHEDGTLDSEFSGNLIEVCPTGVFTDKTFKGHFIRKWDLQSSPSICHGCSLGCNLIASERYGSLRLINNRYHHDLNGYFICDRGRFGYEYVNADDRVAVPLLKDGDGSLKEINEEELATFLKGHLKQDTRLLGIGSPRASLESNFTLRALVGPGNFSTGMNAAEQQLLARILSIRAGHPANNPSIRDLEKADAVLVLGEDLTNTAPRMALALRQSVRNQPLSSLAAQRIPEWSDKSARLATFGQSGPLFSATVQGTRLDDVATGTRHGEPAQLARLGYAIAHALDSSAPAVEGLNDEEQAFVQEAAAALAGAESPAIVSGTSLGDEKILDAAANVALALCKKEKAAHLAYALPEVNSMGSAILGGMSLEDALARAESGEVDALIVMENNLSRRLPAQQVDALFAHGLTVIGIDHSHQPTVDRADLILPSGAFAESDGTVVNFEGRAQRFFQVYPAEGGIQEAWRWIRDLMEFADQLKANEWQSLDDVLQSIEEDAENLRGIARAAPLADFRALGAKIPRMSRRASGRTAINAHVEVSEDKPEDDPDSPFSFSMEGSATTPPPALLNRYWAPGWSSVSSLNKFQDEVGGPLRGGDPGVPLIPSADTKPGDFFNHVPEAPIIPEGKVKLLPLPHIFGSEEWSAKCQGIQARSPGPFLAVHPEDARGWGMEEGDLARLELADGRSLSLPVQYSPTLARGTTGLPVGFPGLEGAALPALTGRPTKAD